MKGVSRDGLHYLLWHRRTANNTIHVVQQDLAVELLISRYSLNRVMRQMEVEGRVRDLTGSGATSKTYEIVDPESWEPK